MALLCLRWLFSELPKNNIVTCHMVEPTTIPKNKKMTHYQLGYWTIHTILKVTHCRGFWIQNFFPRRDTRAWVNAKSVVKHTWRCWVPSHVGSLCNLISSLYSRLLHVSVWAKKTVHKTKQNPLAQLNQTEIGGKKSEVCLWEPRTPRSCELLNGAGIDLGYG